MFASCLTEMERRANVIARRRNIPAYWLNRLVSIPQAAWVTGVKLCKQSCHLAPAMVHFYPPTEEVVKASSTNQIQLLEWLYHMMADRYVPKAVYDYYCNVVFPKYIADDDHNIMDYWADHFKFRGDLYAKGRIPPPHLEYILTKAPEVTTFIEDNHFQEIDEVYPTFKPQLRNMVSKFAMWVLVRLGRGARYTEDEDEHKVLEDNPTILRYLRAFKAFMHSFKYLTSLDLSDTQKEGTLLMPLMTELIYLSKQDCALGLRLAEVMDVAWNKVNTGLSDMFRGLPNVPHLRLLPLKRVGLSHMVTNATNPSKTLQQYKNALECSMFVTIRSGIKRNQLKVLNQLYPYTSDSDSRHMTTRVSSIVEAVIWPRRSNPFKLFNGDMGEAIKNLNSVLKYIPVGTNNTLVSMALMMCLSHKHGSLAYENIVKAGLITFGPGNSKPVLKSFSTAVRRTSRLPNGNLISDSEVTALAYWELAFGRSSMRSDWEQERRNRTGNPRNIISYGVGNRSKPFKWNDQEFADLQANDVDEDFQSRLKDEIYKIVSRLLPKKCTHESWPDFVSRRQEWAASGSSGGAYVDIQGLAIQGKGTLKGTRAKVGKRGYLESTPTQTIVNALYYKSPAEMATASEKFENGKARAIYGVEPLHYCINTYATKGLEERLNQVRGLEKGLSGIKGYAAEINRAKLSGRADIHCTMLDWADFNIHHTPLVQSMLFGIIADVGAKRGAHKDWVRANLWVARAKMNMTCLFPDDPFPAKITQGMFSGTRSTDLINTILNLAYYGVAKRYVADVYNLHPEEEYHVHQGDDVWLSNKKRHWAASIYYVMNNMNFIFQPSKQMFGPGRGEFLRVLYSKGHAYGYAARQLVNYIQRPIQNDLPPGALSWAHTLSESFARLSRRGFTLAGLNMMYDADVDYWTRVKAHKQDDRPISIPSTIMQHPAHLGGFGLPRPAVLNTTNVKLENWPNPPLMEELKGVKLPTYMTDDWVSYVSRKLHGNTKTIRADQLRESLKANNYSEVASAAFANKRKKYVKEAVSKWLPKQIGKLKNATPYRQGKCYQLSKPHHANHENMRIMYPHIAYSNGPENIMRVMSYNVNFNIEHKEIMLLTVRKTLDSVLQNSIFKNLDTTAQALGLSQQKALAWILADTCEKGTYPEADIITLKTLASLPSPKLFEQLTSGAFGPFGALEYFHAPAPLLEVIRISQTIQFVFAMARYEQDHDLYCPLDLELCVNGLGTYIGAHKDDHKVLS